jgi:transcriptional regulator with XRE-family HTH domain
MFADAGKTQEEEMRIGRRLKSLRNKKKLSQGDLEKATGLLRCYISRVENGRTVPGIEVLEKMARALEVPMYRLFYEGENPPKPDFIRASQRQKEINGKELPSNAPVLHQFRRLLARTSPRDQQLLMVMASKMADRRQPAAAARPS